MFRKLTKSVCLLLGLATLQHASAFTLWGPLEAWQTADLDYGNLRYFYTQVQLLTGLGTTENGGPKVYGAGSRLTTPIVTYGFDSTFLDYFGQQGVAAVDSAMQALNALPSASSANLANFITEGNEPINYTAQALDMLDLKSTVMWLMAEHMGLLGETHVFDLLQRFLVAGTIPCDYNYSVVNYNIDPVSHDYSSYVNGRLYTYAIWDGCPIGVNVGATQILPFDSTVSSYTAVATPEGLELGGYYLGMTRDDVGGLQFLYKKNNYAYQALDNGTVATSPFVSSWEAVSATNAVTGISNFAGVLGGVEKITFVKVAYDSYVGTNFSPRTYQYSVPYVTNFTLSKIQVTRTITGPDIVFTAADLVNSEAPFFNYTALTRSGNFIASGYVSPGGGVVPNTISAPMVVVLDNAGPVYLNTSIDPVALTSLDSYQYPVFNWGTFDGSTNPPILYPNGTSLAELEQQVVSGATFNVPLYPWAPVAPPTNNNTTGAGGGAGAGVGGIESQPPVHKKIRQL
jgi:hypothetical protein